MAKKLVICTCGKSFKDSAAMSQHKGNSPKHPPPPKNTSTQVKKPVQRLAVQDQVPDALLIQLIGNQQPRTLYLHSSQLPSQEPVTTVKDKASILRSDGADTLQERNEKTKLAANGPSAGQIYSQLSVMKMDPETRRKMNMSLDEDWCLCDKGCGWCGHCSESCYF